MISALRRKLGTLRSMVAPPLLNRVPAALLWRLKRYQETLNPLQFDIHDFMGEPTLAEVIAGSELLHCRLASGDPLMVTRFGSVELDCLLNYRAVHRRRSRWEAYHAFVQGRDRAFWWDHRVVRSMGNNAGFFPDTVRMVERFCELTLGDFGEFDVLASWQHGERLLDDRLAGVKRVPLFALDVFRRGVSWGAALAGRRVLVVHPFAASIASQYARRHLVFPDAPVLPEFELSTLVPPQTISRNRAGYRTWFDALDDLKRKVAAVPFDVALIGCGAYGMPLAAEVKRMGRQAVHVGGALQMFFGIRGRRWDAEAALAGLYNDHWVRPHESERPTGFHRVEGGCYW